MKKAQILYNSIPAGILSFDNNEYKFEYLKEYLADINLPAISLTLPKQTEPFYSKILFPFFFGLLAEGENKAIQCKLLKLDEDDHFTRLLKTANNDIIGAVSVKEL